MPKPANESSVPKVPSYLRHHGGGRDRAFCYLYDEHGERRRVYLGEWDSPASKRRFREIVGRYLLDDEFLPGCGEVHAEDADNITIVEAVARFLRWKESQVSPSQWSTLDYSLRALTELYGDELASAFGPLKLRRLREHMEASVHRAAKAAPEVVAAKPSENQVDPPDRGQEKSGKKKGRTNKVRALCRREINRRTRRVITLFRWLASEELVAPTIHLALATLPPLRRGRTIAPEAKSITPVRQDDLAKAREHMTPTVRAMVDVQFLTGMRGGELTAMRRSEIDRDGPDGIWIYTPGDHKNAWRGHVRRIPLGPRAQSLLAPYLAGDPTGYVFSPQRSVDERRFMRRQRRKSKQTPSQRERDQQRRDHPMRKLLERWTTETYRGAIHAACGAAGIAVWSPHQLRHSFEVVVERRFGVEAAAKALGHAEIGTTQHYRDKTDLTVAVEVARAMG